MAAALTGGRVSITILFKEPFAFNAHNQTYMSQDIFGVEFRSKTFLDWNAGLVYNEDELSRSVRGTLAF